MKTQIKEHYRHDICPLCRSASVPCEGVPDQALRGCPKCQHTWVEDLDVPPRRDIKNNVLGKIKTKREANRAIPMQEIK